MRARVALTSVSISTLFTLVAPDTAQAACSTATNVYAWGDFWIERSRANCDCVIKAK
jgi:hypothetical protein